MAGTACAVNGATVVWFRYHVASAARRAKFGKAALFSRPSSSRIDAVGSSSRTTITTGAGRSGGTPLLTCAADGKATSLAGEVMRKRTTKTNGATPSNRSHERIG